jgi:hypothetical protein
MKPQDTHPEAPVGAHAAQPTAPEGNSLQRKPYQAPRVESVKLTEEAAEALT